MTMDSVYCVGPSFGQKNYYLYVRIYWVLIEENKGEEEGIQGVPKDTSFFLSLLYAYSGLDFYKDTIH